MNLPERSDYIIGFIFPTNEPNKFKKFTFKQHTWLHRQEFIAEMQFLTHCLSLFYIEFKVTVGVIPMISPDDAGEDSSLIQPSHMACDSVSTS